MFSCLLGTYLGVELLGHTVTLFEERFPRGCSVLHPRQQRVRAPISCVLPSTGEFPPQTAAAHLLDGGWCQVLSTHALGLFVRPPWTEVCSGPLPVASLGHSPFYC